MAACERPIHRFRPHSLNPRLAYGLPRRFAWPSRRRRTSRAVPSNRCSIRSCANTSRRFARSRAGLRDGEGLPRFVEQEFRDFLRCGCLAAGFARFRCTACGLDRFVPFSCKGRGFCPSCGGRRMAERAAHLVDHVLPPVPVRQWVELLERLAGGLPLTPRDPANVSLYLAFGRSIHRTSICRRQLDVSSGPRDRTRAWASPASRPRARTVAWGRDPAFARLGQDGSL